MSQALTFLREFVRKPKQVGAIAPSSATLAKTMVAAANIEAGHAVVELGAGTGPFTRALVANHADAHFLALEPSSSLAGVLRQEFPGIEVVERFAQDLPEIVEDWGYPKIDRILSGLPWTVWPQEVQDSIFDAIGATLKPDGQFVTFTYVHSQVLPGARQLLRTLRERFAEVDTTPIIWANIPPAFVYVCRRPHSTAPVTSVGGEESVHGVATLDGE
ncbi:MAG: SAM-dependent methyltransferase [Proteobacteria bacterium]|jgi:phosphatidylethanolamine/phosphatidyl-N-methylethanolamine N-methyltransferase|nr:SAM-dependent methyltransferase [Pseudomonadota bacterium]